MAVLGGAICLVHYDSERESSLLNGSPIFHCRRRQLLRLRSGVEPHEIEQ